ncbi:MAG TPA: NAD(P)H-hydrate dehydratase [Candidatus Angelobacter sp.]|nr:NAD(P)H-hydrate dehydratase [Candidatus Angelobacter sp.]
MKIVTAEEMRAIDLATTERYGVPSLVLMENAGAAVAEFAVKHFEFASVCVVCGKGNNGGDGFVAARKLHELGKQVSVLVLAAGAEELRGDAAEMFQKLSLAPLWISHDEEFCTREAQQALQSDLIVDAIVGTGFKPPLRGVGRTAVEMINQGSAPVLAVDLPSGAYADSYLPLQEQEVAVEADADAVITFTAPKPIHVFGDLTAGPMAVAPIGSPEELVTELGKLNTMVTTGAELNLAFPPRDPAAHKGDFGHVLVIGGSAGKAGAAAMAGIAALRTGAGLVTVACPKSILPTIASFVPELMTEPLPETADGSLALTAMNRLEQLAKGKRAVVLGPGLSSNPETAQMVRQLLPVLRETSVVLDADGLNAFAGHTHELRGEGCLVLTPHPGEMSRLNGAPVESDAMGRIRIARELANQTNTIVVLKGHHTVTAIPGGEVWINMSGNPGMAKGGSGDVLSGMIAATIAPRREGKTGLLVASAVYLHGLAGDAAADLCGEYSMLATDMIHNISEGLLLGQQEPADKFIYLQR